VSGPDPGPFEARLADIDKPRKPVGHVPRRRCLASLGSGLLFRAENGAQGGLGDPGTGRRRMPCSIATAIAVSTQRGDPRRAARSARPPRTSGRSRTGPLWCGLPASRLFISMREPSGDGTGPADCSASIRRSHGVGSFWHPQVHCAPSDILLEDCASLAPSEAGCDGYLRPGRLGESLPGHGAVAEFLTGCGPAQRVCG
jgi:hypothetical protein